jgi:hypothetical protein
VRSEQTNEPTNKQTNKPTNKQTTKPNQQTYNQTNQPTNNQTNKQTNQQTNQQTNKPNQQTKPTNKQADGGARATAVAPLRPTGSGPEGVRAFVAAEVSRTSDGLPRSFSTCLLIKGSTAGYRVRGPARATPFILSVSL